MNFGLAGIDLPRMNVESVGPAAFEDEADTSLEYRKRQQAEIGATGPRKMKVGNVAIAKIYRMIKNRQIANGEFEEMIIQLISDTRLGIPVERDSAIATVQGKAVVAGVVAIAALLDRAQDALVNREVWRPKTRNRGAGDIFQKTLAAAELILEVCLRKPVAHLVIVAMGGHFVAAGGNFANHPG